MINNLPISEEILRKRQAIPVLIAKLSYVDQNMSLHYMRLWGEKKETITSLYEQLLSEIRKF
ncbi:MAG: hypothetical protein Q8934_10850 [Bacillota bacterium]|nr:hypothetical protein [Bacillota bacterium]